MASEYSDDADENSSMKSHSAAGEPPGFSLEKITKALGVTESRKNNTVRRLSHRDSQVIESLESITSQIGNSIE